MGVAEVTGLVLGNGGRLQRTRAKLPEQGKLRKQSEANLRAADKYSTEAGVLITLDSTRAQYRRTSVARRCSVKQPRARLSFRERDTAEAERD